jgi:hypothetical protein
VAFDDRSIRYHERLLRLEIRLRTLMLRNERVERASPDDLCEVSPKISQNCDLFPSAAQPADLTRPAATAATRLHARSSLPTDLRNARKPFEDGHSKLLNPFKTSQQLT